MLYAIIESSHVKNHYIIMTVVLISLPFSAVSLALELIQ